MFVSAWMPTAGVQHWVLLVLVAAAIDFLVGGPRILGRIPGPDSLLRVIWGAAFGFQEVGAPESSKQGMVVGGLAAVVLLLLALTIGWYIDHIPQFEEWIFLAKALFLALIIGQQSIIRTGYSLARHLDQHAAETAEGKHAAARWTIERVAHRFSDGFAANLTFLMLFGFTGLLGFRVLSVITAIGSPNGVMRPRAGLYRPAAELYNLASLIPGAVSAFILAVAMTVTSPRGLGNAVAGLIKLPPKGALFIRWQPITVLCYGLGITVKADPNATKSDLEWIGAEGARARARASDIRATILAVLAGEIIILAALVALLTFSEGVAALQGAAAG